MGLFSSFSRKPSNPSSASSSHHSSGASGFSHPDGKISRLEISKVHHDLISRFGRTKGERIYAELQPNMDKDHGFGSSGISAREAEDTMRNMESNPYDGIDKHDTEKLRDILDKRL